jgi:hypothetical protein
MSAVEELSHVTVLSMGQELKNVDKVVTYLDL